MDYSYNYRHLREFMEAHRLAKKDLLEALGCGDYVSLNKWLDGKVPVHITAMLRFCNYYNVPLEDFFFDGDALPVQVRPQLPNADSQLLPTDGYGIKEGRGRGIVETRIDKRQVSSQEQAAVVADGLARQTAQRNERDTAMAQIGTNEENFVSAPPSLPVTTPTQSITESILRLKLEHANELRQAEREHHEREDRIRRDCQTSFDAERNRLMDIIERQNTELSKLYQQGRGTGGHWDSMMAAEDGPRG